MSFLRRSSALLVSGAILACLGGCQEDNEKTAKISGKSTGNAADATPDQATYLKRQQQQGLGTQSGQLKGYPGANKKPGG